MNEPPGARARVALTGLTVAEYFRDAEGQDVLLFIDNIFRLAYIPQYYTWSGRLNRHLQLFIVYHAYCDSLWLTLIM